MVCDVFPKIISVTIIICILILVIGLLLVFLWDTGIIPGIIGFLSEYFTHPI